MVYVFILKKFYVENNVDLPMAINNDDIKVFKKKDDAISYRNNCHNNCKDLAKESNSYRATTFIEKENGIPVVVLHFKNRTRFCFEVIETEMVENLF